MNQDELILRELRNRGCTEPAKVTRYVGYRHGKPNVTLEVHDSGEGESARFMVYVREVNDEEEEADLDQPVATGNPMATLEDALMLVHWGDVGMSDYQERPD